MRKRIAVIFSLLLVWVLFSNGAYAFVPYASYTVDVDKSGATGYWLAPAAYTPVKEYVFGDCGGLKGPEDVVSDPVRKIMFVVDTGNNRILQCDQQFNVQRVITEFTYDGHTETFKQPEGLYSDRYSKQIYVCDTENGRIIVFDENFKCVRIFTQPDILLSNDVNQFKYLPAKVLVDMGGRMYVILRGMNKGIMELSAEGEFTGFTGAPPVKPDLWQTIYRFFMTKEQKSKMLNFVPTEFDNFTFDEASFIYAVSQTQTAAYASEIFTQANAAPGSVSDLEVDEDASPVKKLNPKGENVLKYDVLPPLGDTALGWWPNFVDVVYGGEDVYALLETSMGKIFCYNGDGDFMYVFGTGAAGYQVKGGQLGTFKSPRAIERLGENYFILDYGTGTITEFEPTEYGKAINKSVSAYYKGDYDDAYLECQKILRYNANNSLAYQSIGKILLRKGQYKESLDYFKTIGFNGQYASEAFKHYRKEVIQKYNIYIFAVLILILAAAILYSIYKRINALVREVRNGR